MKTMRHSSTSPQNNKRKINHIASQAGAYSHRLGAVGDSWRATVQTHHLDGDLKDKLDQAMEATVGSLSALQWQVATLGKVVVQNRRTLDYLAAQPGCVCVWGGIDLCHPVGGMLFLLK